MLAEMVLAQVCVPPPRIYEKGERRHKHVGSTDLPTIEFDRKDPQKWVGKCPRMLPEPLRTALLNEAIAVPNGDRELTHPKKLYVVHEGAIYEAQTSDHGRSYHAYPYRGKLPKPIIAALREMAERKGCLDAFEQWTRQHIEIHGR